MTHRRAVEDAESRPSSEGGGRAPVLVLGVGNILLGDEGLGVRAVEAVQQMKLPRGVELLDGATAGADLIDAIADRERVIVIDAVEADVPPGTILRFTAEDFARRAATAMSLHQVGLADALAMARLLASAPRETIVIGVRPKEVLFSLDLSDEVVAAMPRVVSAVLAEIERPR